MMQLKTLSSKAMLVKLTTRRANLTKRDMMAEEYLQAELGDTAFIVNKKLFRDPTNPINQIMSKASEVYTYHKKHTLAYIDKGPRLLPNSQYFDYTTNMRNIIQEVDNMMAIHMPNYDKYVQLDVQSRIAFDAGRPKPARYVAPNVDDYPTADEFIRGMGHDIRFSPLPEAKHFLFDISDADMEAFNQTMEEVQKSARSEVIKKMMQPLGHLIDKLNKPIGTEGAIFRESAIENIIDGVNMARKLNMEDDTEINQMADTIERAISIFNNNSAVLRESPIVRENTAKKLDEIAKQMGFLYGNN
jgi:hypothetical protein